MKISYVLFLGLLVISSSIIGQNTSSNNESNASTTQINTDKIYKIKEVDYAPVFSKGKMSQKDFLRIYLKYPQEAIEKNIEGTVIISFIVDKNGEISSPSILQGDHALLNQEAIRLASLIPYYTPGYVNDVPVSTQVLFPIDFSLDNIKASEIASPTAIEQDTIATPSSPQNEAISYINPANNTGEINPIYIIDGNMVNSNINLDASKIESIRVIKGSKALQLYGQTAKNGVVIITTKTYKDTK